MKEALQIEVYLLQNSNFKIIVNCLIISIYSSLIVNIHPFHKIGK